MVRQELLSVGQHLGQDGLDLLIQLGSSSLGAIQIGLSFQTTAAQLDQEVQAILAQVLADTKKLLSDHRSLLDEVALYLLAKETITGDELMRYVNANQTAQPATVSQDPAED